MISPKLPEMDAREEEFMASFMESPIWIQVMRPMVERWRADAREILSLPAALRRTESEQSISDDLLRTIIGFCNGILNEFPKPLDRWLERRKEALKQDRNRQLEDELLRYGVGSAPMVFDQEDGE